MHVIIVGAGEVGSFVAQRLSREGHDVAIIDRDKVRLRQAEDRLDALTVLGNGASPLVLERAGLHKADLLVSVTNNDEANLLAAFLAKQAKVSTAIVRIESDDLRSREAAHLRRSMGADMVIDPDLETAEAILALLEFPGAIEIAQMAGGEVMIVGARLQPNAPVVGRTLRDLAAEYEPYWEFLFGAITRGDKTIIPREDLRLEADDHARVLCSQRGRRQLLRLLGVGRHSPRNVMLLGGGHTAEIVARRLEARGAQVRIVERDAARAQELAESVGLRTIILHGEITDADLLDEELIGRMDAVVALTGEDDANVLACLHAKAAGASETIAVVHRLSRLPYVHQWGIDVALSPRTATANAVLRYVRGEGVTSVTTFLEGEEAEVLELEVKDGSAASGSLVSELRLPKDVLIGAIVRAGNAEIARGRSRLREKDRVIAFAMPKSVDAAKRVFA